jgi:hydroxymethylglutaryl-CoA reductase (NADPH)
MSIIPNQVARMLDRLRASFSAAEAGERLNPRRHPPPAAGLRGAPVADRASIGSLWESLRAAGAYPALRNALSR